MCRPGKVWPYMQVYVSNPYRVLSSDSAAEVLVIILSALPAYMAFAKPGKTIVGGCLQRLVERWAAADSLARR